MGKTGLGSFLEALGKAYCAEVHDYYADAEIPAFVEWVQKQFADGKYSVISQTMTELSEANFELQQQVDTLNGRLQAVTRELEQKRQEIEKQRASGLHNRTLRSQVKSLQRQIKQRKDAVPAMNRYMHQVITLRGELADARAEADAHRGKASKFDQILLDRAETHKELEQVCGALAEAIGERDTFRIVCEAAASVTEDARAERDETIRNRDGLQAELDRQIKRNGKLNDELNRLRQACQLAQAEIGLKAEIPVVQAHKILERFDTWSCEYVRNCEGLPDYSIALGDGEVVAHGDTFLEAAQGVRDSWDDMEYRVGYCW